MTMITLNCSTCGNPIQKTKTEALYWKTHYCSKQCNNEGQKRRIIKNCSFCLAELSVWPSRLREHNFCGKVCTGKYYAKNAITAGHIVAKRSKLEIFLENELRSRFPFLDIFCNYLLPENRLTLDFYFPDLNLGLEINGIYHYQAVKGGEKNFLRVQKNDALKKELCKKVKIELISIKTLEPFKNKQATNNHWRSVFEIILSRIPFCKEEKDAGF